MLQSRTDLAMESLEGSGQESMPGVQVNHWDAADIQITEVIITDGDSARQLGKPLGDSLTLECSLLRERDPDARLAMASLLAEEVRASCLRKTQTRPRWWWASAIEASRRTPWDRWR